MADNLDVAPTDSKPSDDEWLALAREAFVESTNFFDAGVRKEMEQDLRQFLSLHPRDSKYESELYRLRSRFFVPKTRASIRKSEATAAAAFFSNADVVSIEPEDQDDKEQVAGAQLINELVNERLRNMPWFLTVMGAFQDAKALGVCCSYQYWCMNEEKQIDKPDVRLCPLENVRFSPGASWIDPVNTSPYFIEMLPMYVKDVRARMTAPEGNEPKWMPAEDSDLLAARVGFSDTITQQRNAGRADPASQPGAVNAFTVVWVHRNIVEWDGVDYVFYTLGKERLLSKPVPLKKVYFHGQRPYVIGFVSFETHRLYPMSTPRMTRSTQGELNEIRNQRIDNIKFAMNKRYFVKRGAQVDLRSIMRNVPGSATLMNDPEKDVKVVETQDVTRSAFEEQDRLNLDFDDLAGSFSQSSVQSNRKLNETVGGLELLSADASQVGNYELRIFAETWYKPVIAQLVDLERYYETDDALLARSAKIAQIQDQGVSVVDAHLMMTKVRVTAHVGIGATTPQKRLTDFLFALRSLAEILENQSLQGIGLDVKEVASEIFGKLGYDSGDRFFDWDTDDPQVLALKSQMGQLQDQLNRKDPPEVVAEKVNLLKAQTQEALQRTALLQAQKVKTGVEGIFGGVQAAEVIAAVPAVAPVADQVMRAAGYETPTPPGIDPGFAPGQQGPDALAAPGGAPGITMNPVKSGKTGAQFQPGGAAMAAQEGMSAGGPAPGVPPSTNPLTPKPIASPSTGVAGFNGGIETRRPDSEGPGK